MVGCWMVYDTKEEEEEKEKVDSSGKDIDIGY